jgi:hypothetical protein
MKKTLAMLWVIVVVGCCYRFATAATIYGASGLILTPSAYVPPDRAVGFGLSTFTVKPPTIERRWLSSTVDFGVGGRSELGLTYLRRTGGTTETGFGGFAKYQLQQETSDRPALSIGVDLIGGDVKTSQVYLVGTKRVSSADAKNPLTLTLGAVYAKDRDGIRRHDTDLFGGFDVKLAPHLNLIGEFRSRTKGDSHHGSGVMVMYGAKRYGIGIGFVNNGRSESHRFFIGVGYNVSTLD